jgi:outer membrane receptor protein involved in Fe transport
LVRKLIFTAIAFGLTVGLILPQLGVAGTTGKISGTVTNEETGEPLPGVAVSIAGTKMGALTDENGEYFILNVPVGTYTLKASLIGFAPVEVVNLDISVDLTTYNDISLSQKALELGKTIIVTAERPLIIKDKTASIKLVEAEEIQNMPTRGYQDVVGLQAGVVRFRDNPTNSPRGGPPAANRPHLFIRGGRPSEVAYFVDGFSTQDPLAGISTTVINNNALAEIEVTTGGFNAEYGWVASGVVNATTKEGTKDFSGSVEAVTDNITSDNYDYNIYAANVGGPIPGLEASTFFFSGERRWQRDREPSGLVDEKLPNNSLGGWSGQGKVSLAVSDDINVKMGGVYSLDNWQEYRHSFYFNTAHTPRYKDQNLSLYLKWTQTLSPRTFFNVAGNYYFVERIRGDGVYFDDLYAYGRPKMNPKFDETGLFYSWDDIEGPTDILFDYLIDSAEYSYMYDYTDSQFVDPDWIYTDSLLSDSLIVYDTLTDRKYVLEGDEAYVWDDFYHRKSYYYGFDFDLTSQIAPRHLVKFGVDFQRHSIRYYRHLFPTFIGGRAAWEGIDHYGYDLQYNETDTDDWRFDIKNPITFAVYMQDKFEWQDLVINAGVRFDYYDSRALGIRNEEIPFANLSNLERTDVTESEAETRLSPRLGIGFPVSDRTVVHLSYGKFFQRPDLNNLYVGYDFYEYMVTGGFYYPFGNPNLEPEKTTAYEFGLSHQLGDYTSIDVTAYYKDVENLTQVRTISAVPESYSIYFNDDFGTVKGIDLALKMRRMRSVALDLNYTLAWASGTGSFATSNNNIAWTRSETPMLTAPLAFDQRHKITGIVDIRSGKGQGPMIGDVYPLENAGVNFIVNLGSGVPYSPSRLDADPVTLYSVSFTPDGPINSSNMPWTFRIDMKANKTFAFGNTNVDVYVWVLNLLDRDNPLFVYETSGDPKATNWLNTQPGEEFQETYSDPHDTSGLTGLEKYELKQEDPGNYDIPRQVRFGVRVSF